MLQTKFGKGGLSRYFPPCWDENILIRSFSKDHLATIQKLRAGVKMQSHKTKKIMVSAQLQKSEMKFRQVNELLMPKIKKFSIKKFIIFF